ncbi:MAG: type II toxin-antitoxin system RelE/ParE family toxin [Sulfurimonas sp.]|uniref:type II toxin-antitoxin system RelE/ParE family toxin n=1 Tax=Sulfurimonas sp. TaxID=2022749 RepID=UPI002621D4A0|nr:type II toxin-antitoxin system RelE/ParE family toxin [Sulfurimonas sp.]MDD5400985.1 type II toxin-antitoxin system RelE/ParE family toxin [Sulfurimonas sp.]
MHKIVFSKIAALSLVEQAKYIFEQTKNEDVADRYLDKMKNYIIQTLSNFPKSGRPTEELLSNTRKLVYQGYSIIYSVSDTQIEILVIFRENLPKL